MTHSEVMAMVSDEDNQMMAKEPGPGEMMVCGIRCGWEGTRIECEVIDEDSPGSFDPACPDCGAACEPNECNHEFGEQYTTQYKDIYGKKCKKCGFVQFDKGEMFSGCGCRFENAYSNAVVLCEKCSQLPCHCPHNEIARR